MRIHSMPTYKKVIKYGAIAIILLFFCLVFYQYFNSGNPRIVNHKRSFEIVAHRGVHLNYQKGVYDKTTGCEAIHIFEPKHEFVENTIESIGAAFEFGATIVEIDIRQTGDNNIVVFHDDKLECRTDGTGNVIDKSTNELKKLDIGFGYTFDHGKSYPFRGKWIGKMPTLKEVLDTFNDKKFLIDQKDGTKASVELLIDIVNKLPQHRQKHIYYWGREKYYNLLSFKIPSVTPLFGTRSQIKKWGTAYILTLGLSGFPSEASGLVIGIPSNYTKYLWGWPYKFLHSVKDAGAYFFLLIDTKEDALKLRHLPIDGIVTDYIEDIGPYFTEKNKIGLR
jgi:glycerophosphoryl diester phosphodiesterase